MGTDDTVDIQRGTAGSSDELRPVALVQGSGPDVTGEIQQVRCGRLRLESWVMFCGFALFLLRH